MAKQETYEIWQSKNKTERAIFSTNKSKKEYDFLTRDTDGRKMILKKTFRSSSRNYARRVWKRYFGY